MFIFAWLLKNRLPALIGGAALLAVVGYVGVLKYQLSSARDEVTELNGKVAALEAEQQSLVALTQRWNNAYTQLSALTKSCNDSVQALAKDSEEKQRKAAEAIKKAKLVSEHYQSTIDDAYAREIAKAGSCEQAVSDAKADLRGLL